MSRNRPGESPSLREMTALVAVFDQGRSAEAERLARSLTEGFPRHGFGWKMLGAVFQQQGRAAEALVAKQRAVDLLPTDAEAHSNLGNAFQEQGRLAEAEASLRRALALAPDHAVALNNLGLTLMKQGRLADAEACLQRALAIQPGYASGHNNLGITLLKSQRHAEAEACFRRALEIAPDYADAYSNLGNALQELGRLAEAEAAYQRALTLQPHLAEAHTNLGKTLQELGRLSEAEACHRRAIGIKPKLAEAYCNLGNVLISRCDRHPAVAAYQQALDLDPGAIGQSAAVCLAIHHYLKDDWALCRDALLAAKPIMNTTLAECQAMRIYWRYLDKLMSRHPHAANTSHPRRQAMATLYVIGESHALAAHGAVVNHRGEEMACVAQWIGGCKQWHLGNGKPNKYKCHFERVLGQIPPQSTILLNIGEIDCRQDEGIVKAWRSVPDAVLDDVIRATAQAYLRYVADAVLRYRHRLIVGGVPAPNIPTGILDETATKTLIHVIRTLNAMLRDLALAAGMDFLDVHALTDRGDGVADGNWHIDHHHLLPDAYPKAFETRCIYGAAGEGERGGSAMPAPGIRDEKPAADELNALVAAFNQGRYAEVEAMAGALTSRFPRHAFGWKTLGVIYQRQGRLDEALMAKSKAVELSPDDEGAHSNLGNALQAKGCLQEAERSFRRALAIRADFAEAYGNLGNVLNAQERFSEAELAFRHALTIRADYPEAYCNLGIALIKQGRVAEAEASFRSALTSQPRYSEALSALGICFARQERHGEAEACLRRAIEINPESAEAYFNLGITLFEVGRLAEAEASFRKVVEIKPDYAEAHDNLGNSLHEQKRFADAETCFRRALEIKPEYAGAYSNLGVNLKEQGRLAESVASYRRALEINPNSPEALGNLALGCFLGGDSAAGMAALEKAIGLSPDNAKFRLARVIEALPILPDGVAESAASVLEFDRQLDALAEWLGHSADRRACLASVLGSQQPYYLAYRAGNHVHRLSCYGDLVAGALQQKPVSCVLLRDRVRLVIVSECFRRHSVWDIIVKGLLVNIDRTQFEIVLYHVGHVEDDETALARSLADVWRDARTLSNIDRCVSALAEDVPDVIFYPEIGMDPVSLGLAARRLAPLQAASWGHPITTGLPTIDLYFSGENIDSARASSHYRETLVRLPGTGCCTTPIGLTPERLPELEAELCLRRGAIFLIAQRAMKFDPADDALYARIAAAAGESTFILLSDPRYPWATDRIIDRLAHSFRSHGLDPVRHLLVLPWLSREQFYGLLDVCDVYLDCPSFSGYTTAWQAVHRGLPVVTQDGEFLRQRLAAGLLRKLGLTDTIATSVDEYIAIAVQLAEECKNAGLRRARREALKNAAPLCDHDTSVVRAFERSVIDALAVRGRHAAPTLRDGYERNE